MFLNSIGQIVAGNTYDGGKNTLGVQLSSPMLLLDSETLSDIIIPDGWQGELYTTAEILECIKKQKHTQLQEKRPTIVMRNYEATLIELEDENIVEVTVIPMSSKDMCKVMALVKDQYVNNLVTNLLSDCLYDYSSNLNLRKSIQQGIDVLYVNDRTIKDKTPSTESTIYPTRTQICELMEFVKPKYLRGFYGTDLSNILTNCMENLII